MIASVRGLLQLWQVEVGFGSRSGIVGFNVCEHDHDCENVGVASGGLNTIRAAESGASFAQKISEQA